MVKRLVKYFLVVLSAIVTALFIVGALLGYQAYLIKNDVAALLHNIQSGASVDSQKQLTSKINSEISRTATILELPIFRPVVHRYIPDPHSEFVLARTMIKLAPSIMGSERPKKYLLVFQNSAEARGTGGIIGAYAELQISRGKITVLRQGSNVGLQSQVTIPVAMPDEYNALYGSDPGIWQNSNMSPHFPYAAKIWSALWQKQFHEKLDGVLATDPIALSYVLRATGPITLASGEKITASNVVEKTLSTAYKRFESDNNARKEYLVEVMKAVVNELTSGRFSKLTFAREIQTPVLDRRILFAIANRTDQIQLLPTIISGNLDLHPNNEFRAILLNTAGNKLDYYLSKKISITAKACGKPLETAFQVTIRNHLKKGTPLPDYVLGRLDLKLSHGAQGRQGYALLIYGPSDAEITSALRSDQSQESPFISHERHRPIAIFKSDLAPSTSETYTVDFSGGIGPITYVKQPLVKPEGLTRIKSCR